MADLYANFATTTLAGGAGGVGTALNNGDATLYVSGGTGGLFPSPANVSQRVRLVISNSSVQAQPEIVYATGRSGDTLTGLARAQEGSTTPASWPASGATVITNDETAGGLNLLWTRIADHGYNVREFGATGNGTTDDTAAIQAAITACQTAGGGIVYFPAGTYVISSTLTVSADNVQLLGVGWGAQLSAAAGFASSTSMIQVQAPGGAGNFRYGIRIADLYLNGNTRAGINGIDLISTYHAVLDNLRLYAIPGIGVNMDGAANAFGAYNVIRDCRITNGGAGIGIETNFSEWLLVLGGTIAWYNTAGGVGIKCQNLNCSVIGTQFDECDTSIWQYFSGRLLVHGCQFDRGLTRFIYLQGSQFSSIIGNSFNTYSGTTGTGALEVGDGANAGNVVSGNTLRSGSGWTNFLDEHGTVGTPPNTYLGNDTGGSAVLLVSGVAQNNRGYNPVQSLTTPPAPGVSNAATGGTVAAGTYQVEVTLVSATGETAGSAAANTTTSGSTSTITVTSPTQTGNAIGWYAYVTQAGGAANTATRQQTVGSPTAFGTNLTLTAPPTNTGATVPTSNTTTDVTTPAIPASGTAIQNTTGVEVTVYLAGGTVTAITIGNKATGLTSGALRLPARQTIALTYSVSPTWVWLGS